MRSSENGQRGSEPNALAGEGRAAVGAALLFALCMLGCGDGSGSGFGTSERGSAHVGGTIVSTVNGHPISIAEVRAFAERSGLPPRAALDRLQAELLLMGEAERRGVASPEIDLVGARARAQALLDREAAAVTVSDAELRAAYEGDARFHQPERRASVHVLALLGKKPTPEQDATAKRIASEALKEIGALTPEQIVERYKGTRDGLELRAERLPPVDRQGRFVEEFLVGLFSRNDPGVIAEPVRTKFGWHAIRLLEILPAETVPFEQAAPALREELLVQRRQARTAQLLTDLRQRYGAVVEREALEKLAVVGGE